MRKSIFLSAVIISISTLLQIVPSASITRAQGASPKVDKNFTNFTALNPKTLIDSRTHKKINPMIPNVASYLNYLYRQISRNDLSISQIREQMQNILENGYSAGLYFVTEAPEEANNYALLPEGSYQGDRLFNSPVPSSFITIYDHHYSKFLNIPYCLFDDRWSGVKHSFSDPVQLVMQSGDCAAYLDKTKSTYKYPPKFLPFFRKTPGIFSSEVAGLGKPDSSNRLYVSKNGESVTVKVKIENPEIGKNLKFSIRGANAFSSFLYLGSEVIHPILPATSSGFYEHTFTRKELPIGTLGAVCKKTPPEEFQIDYWFDDGGFVFKDGEGESMMGQLPQIIVNTGCTK
jgi:hypothetical protein